MRLFYIFLIRRKLFGSFAINKLDVSFFVTVSSVSVFISLSLSCIINEKFWHEAKLWLAKMKTFYQNMLTFLT